jgi:hypothetical protein
MDMRQVVTQFGRPGQGESLGMLGAPDEDGNVVVCEATLPSSSAVDRLFEGDPWAVPAVIVSTALRGGLVAAGAYAAGVRGENVAGAGLGGALFIEAFVIAWVGYQKLGKKR